MSPRTARTNTVGKRKKVCPHCGGDLSVSLETRVLRFVAEKEGAEFSRVEVAEALKCQLSSADNTLYQMMRAGFLVRTRPGFYQGTGAARGR